MLTVSLTLRSYIRTPLRSLMVFFALLCSSAGLTAVTVINNTAKDHYTQAQQPLLKNVRYYVSGSADAPLTKSLYAQLRRAGFNNLIAVNQKYVALESEKARRFISVIAFDSFAILSLSGSERTRQFEQSDTFLPALSASWQVPGQLLIHPDFARQLDVNNGDQLSTTDQGLLPPLLLAELPGLGQQVVTDIATFHSIFEPSSITAYYLVGDLSEARLTALKDALPEGTSLKAMNTGENAAELTESFHLNIFAMSLMMFVVCLFIAANAMNLLLSQRESNIRVLRQLGVSRKSLIVSQSIEMILLGTIMSIPGVFMGIYLAGLLAPAVMDTLDNLYGVHVGYAESSFVSLYLISASSCGIGAFLAALAPLYRLNQRVFNRHDLALPPQDGLWQLAGAGLLIAAACLWTAFDNIANSFAIIALVIFSGCFWVIGFLPTALNGICNQLSKRNVLLHYAFADAARLSRRTKVAYCAFFIAVAANLGMNLMVDSFRQATQDWLSQRLNATAYLSVAATQHEQLVDWHNNAYSNVTLIPRLSLQVNQGDESIVIRSLTSSRAFRNAMQFDRVSTAHWEQFDSGVGTFINQQWMFSKGVAIGDTIAVDFPDGTTHRFKVSGVYRDYGNPNRQMVLPLEYLQRFKGEVSNYALMSETSAAIDDFANQLDMTNIEYQLFRKERILGLSMETFDQTFVITDSLNIVTLLVAAFSLTISILILNRDQAPEQALMRSLGLSRHLLFFLNSLQYLSVTLLAAMLAVPFGIVLSWLLINLVNVQAFYWQYPLVFNWLDIASLLTLSTLLVVIAASVPLFQRANRPLIQDVKWLS